MENRDEIVQVRVTPGELEMVKGLCKSYGGIKQGDLIRRLIQERHRKEFPAYKMSVGQKEKKQKEEITDEQWCEKFGGKIIEEGEVVKCEFVLKGGGTTLRFVASDRKAIEKFRREYEVE